MRVRGPRKCLRGTLYRAVVRQLYVRTALNQRQRGWRLQFRAGWNEYGALG